MSAPLLTLPASLLTYLSTLTDTHYTATARVVSSHPSTIIHSNGTTTPSTFTRYEVWLEATACDYTTLFHYVTRDALGRLGGLLK